MCFRGGQRSMVKDHTLTIFLGPFPNVIMFLKNSKKNNCTIVHSLSRYIISEFLLGGFIFII